MAGKWIRGTQQWVEAGGLGLGKSSDIQRLSLLEVLKIVNSGHFAHHLSVNPVNKHAMH
jgi:hypothetical protein